MNCWLIQGGTPAMNGWMNEWITTLLPQWQISDVLLPFQGSLQPIVCLHLVYFLNLLLSHQMSFMSSFSSSSSSCLMKKGKINALCVGDLCIKRLPCGEEVGRLFRWRRRAHGESYGWGCGEDTRRIVEAHNDKCGPAGSTGSLLLWDSMAQRPSQEVLVQRCSTGNHSHPFWHWWHPSLHHRRLLPTELMDCSMALAGSFNKEHQPDLWGNRWRLRTRLILHQISFICIRAHHQKVIWVLFSRSRWMTWNLKLIYWYWPALVACCWDRNILIHFRRCFFFKTLQSNRVVVKLSLACSLKYSGSSSSDVEELVVSHCQN